MKRLQWVLLLFGIFALLLQSARLGLTATPTPSPGITPPPSTPAPIIPRLDYFSGQATISTGNCNSSSSTPPGLCQPAPAPNGGAGPNPDIIEARVMLCETRTTSQVGSGQLTVVGGGTGFKFGKTYVSLLYKNPSVSTCSRFPAGVDATLENTTNPLSGVDNDFASMHLGFWVVSPDGSATLNVTKQATLTGLNDYATVSVREMQPLNEYFDRTRDPAPQLNALRACGALTVVRTASNLNCLFTN